MDSPTIAGVAASLSEAQRAALTSAIDLGWMAMTKIETGRSARALHRLGLTNLSWAPSSLTELGLAVKAYLEANHDS